MRKKTRKERTCWAGENLGKGKDNLGQGENQGANMDTLSGRTQGEEGKGKRSLEKE